MKKLIIIVLLISSYIQANDKNTTAILQFIDSIKKVI